MYVGLGHIILVGRCSWWYLFFIVWGFCFGVCCGWYGGMVVRCEGGSFRSVCFRGFLVRCFALGLGWMCTGGLFRLLLAFSLFGYDDLGGCLVNCWLTLLVGRGVWVLVWFVVWSLLLDAIWL